MKKIINFIKKHKEGIVIGTLSLLGMKISYEYGKANKPVHATMIFIKHEDADNEKETEDD